jgi:hypothetical protein
MWLAARSSVPEPEGVPAHVIFLIRGHSWATQCWIASWSRSVACRCGRWTVQPSRSRSSRHTDGRKTQGKSARDIRRCLKRAVARQLFKLLERYDHVGVQLVSVA